MALKNTSVRLEPEQIKSLAVIGKKERRKPQELIRFAIDDFIAVHKKAAKKATAAA